MLFLIFCQITTLLWDNYYVIILFKIIYSQKNLLLEILKISTKEKGYIDDNLQVFLQILFEIPDFFKKSGILYKTYAKTLSNSYLGVLGVLGGSFFHNYALIPVVDNAFHRISRQIK